MIKLYVTKTCPRCHAVKSLLDGAEYTIEDMTTPAARTDLVMAGVFVLSAPVLQLGDKYYTSDDIFENDAVRPEIRKAISFYPCRDV